MPEPWAFDGTGTFTERMMEQIVGFRMVIETLEGKFKLNQNHPLDRQRKVVRALNASESQMDQAVAALMESRTPGLQEDHSV